MADLVSIVGFYFPEPSIYNATSSPIVDSARNVSGYVVGAIVRYDVAKIEMSWKYITAYQWSQIISYIGIKTGIKTMYTYLDKIIFMC